MKIVNKKIMITGSTSGIGKVIKDKLSKNNMVDNYSRSNGYDLADDSSVDKIIDKLKDYDYIFLNSGVFYMGNSNKLDNDDLVNMIKINALANIKILNYLYDQIAENKIKVIVTLSTTIGISGVHQAAYNASKKMLNEYIIALNTEFIDQNKEGKIFRFIPHYIKGTKMTGGDKIDPSINLIIDELIESIESGKFFYMPQEKLYKGIFKKYFDDPYLQGIDSVKYRRNKNE